MNIPAIFFIFLIAANSVIADEKDTTEDLLEYDIEIIIFEDAHARYINSESWDRNNTAITGPSSSEKGDIHTTKKTKDTETDKTAASYKTITPKILNKEYKRINRSSEFNVLFYSAWRQTGLKASDAFEIEIDKLNNAHKNKSDNTLAGSLKVVLARYLHFYSQLEYKQRNNPDNQNEMAPGDIETAAESLSPVEGKNTRSTTDTLFSIQSHRRMRSKELHYIDHPLVGILIQINPVEVSHTEQNEQASAFQFQTVALTHH